MLIITILKFYKLLFEKLIVVELATDKKTEFEKVKTCAFNGELANHLAVHLAKERTPGVNPMIRKVLTC